MEQKKVSPSRAKKKKIVAKLSEKLAKSKGLVFANYQGLTHVQLEKLKKAIKPLNAELVITKNTLLKLSLLNSKQRDSGVVLWTSQSPPQNDVILASERSSRVQNPLRISDFEGPTATLFLYGDPIAPLKQLAKTIKELNLPSVKFGIIDKQTLTSEQVLSLAALPPYNVLIAQLLFQIKAPIYRLHRALGWNIQRLVMTLKAIETKKNS